MVSGEAVQIVRLDKTSNGLDLNLEALKEICFNEKCRDRPICVVSIAGDFRKGKSFMLNFFLRYLYHVSSSQHQLVDVSSESDWLNNPDEELSGFSWRGGSDPETTGILLWSDPIVIRQKGGKEIAVLLMDTQGAFDSRQTIGQTAIIFALSTLTSSIQIYNVMSNIQEDNLQILDTFLAYGQLVLDQTASSEKPFQQLCFLVRDWRSPKDFPYGAIGGQQLLDKKLSTDLEEPDSPDNNTRKRIENCFEKRCCYLLPFPGERVSVDDGEPFKGQLKDMKKDFVQHIRTFVPSILNPDQLVVKKISGVGEVKGEELFHYFKTYADTYKSEKIPEAKNLYDATAEASNLAAVATAKNNYLNSMKEVCGPNKPYINPNILEQKHEQLLRESLQTFKNTKKLGESDYSQRFYDDLKTDILSSYSDFVEFNKSKNMFNIWGSPLIMLGFWFLAFILGRIFDLIGIAPLANMFNLQATVCFIIIIFYLGMKFTGNYPNIVVAIDQVTEAICLKGMGFVMDAFMNNQRAQIAN